MRPVPARLRSRLLRTARAASVIYNCFALFQGFRYAENRRHALFEQGIVRSLDNNVLEAPCRKEINLDFGNFDDVSEIDKRPAHGVSCRRVGIVIPVGRSVRHHLTFGGKLIAPRFVYPVSVGEIIVHGKDFVHIRQLAESNFPAERLIFIGALHYFILIVGGAALFAVDYGYCAKRDRALLIGEVDRSLVERRFFGGIAAVEGVVNFRALVQGGRGKGYALQAFVCTRGNRSLGRYNALGLRIYLDFRKIGVGVRAAVPRVGIRKADVSRRHVARKNVSVFAGRHVHIRIYSRGAVPARQVLRFRVTADFFARIHRRLSHGQTIRTAEHRRHAFRKRGIVGRLNDDVGEYPFGQEGHFEARNVIDLPEVDKRPAHGVSRRRVDKTVTHPIFVLSVRHNVADGSIAARSVYAAVIGEIVVHGKLCAHVRQTAEARLFAAGDVFRLGRRGDLASRMLLCFRKGDTAAQRARAKERGQPRRNE